jgi:O-methyltransferase
MVGLARLKNLVRLAELIDLENIAGDIVECGTWNGGSGALLAQVGARSPHERMTWLFDSFEGLPAPSEKDGKAAVPYRGKCRGATDSVREVLGKLAVPETRARIVPGWFQDTLAQAPIQRIALLHIDADWYESVRFVLDTLYPRVTPGGYVVLDDYGYWQGCRTAWEEFQATLPAAPALVSVDGIGCFLRKPALPTG